MNDNSDIFQITGTTLDIESQVSKLNDDINIKMRASSVAEGTGENEKPLTTGSIYNNNQIVFHILFCNLPYRILNTYSHNSFLLLLAF